MDITQSLKDAENSLRDFISSVLSQSHGTDWVDKCGVSLERLLFGKNEKYQRKKAGSGVVDERLIYYADFYDLKTIMKKHWSGEFSKALATGKHSKFG